MVLCSLPSSVPSYVLVPSAYAPPGVYQGQYRCRRPPQGLGRVGGMGPETESGTGADVSFLGIASYLGIACPSARSSCAFWVSNAGLVHFCPRSSHAPS